MTEGYLYERINDLKTNRIGQQIIPNVPKEYDFILKNLNPNKAIRNYQLECLENFYLYNCAFKEEQQEWHLFHMATGSGKTYIMAALILYYYKQGYRNFLFFVNQRAIVEKTKENFLNRNHSKYLFTNTLNIDGKKIDIKDVKNFKESKKDRINIIFTTIQGLHDNLNMISENGISWNDFKEKMVLIADEAHHLNTNTRLKGKEKKEEEENSKHWEETVKDLYRCNAKNVMLEFTATCDLKNKNISEKYKGETGDIIFNYPLQEFRKSGYTKELAYIRTELRKMHKIVQAMILSQYRLKLFESNNIKKANTKPVVLCKEDGTKENLNNTFEEFLDFMKNKFSAKDLEIIRNQATGFVKEAFDYFDKNGITNSELINELKISFSEKNAIKIHSGIKNLPELLIELNDLENPKNQYRIIFTLDMLSEGWDVLNLFDIVRLSEQRKDSSKKVSATTIQEAQLIGRGARYYPYKLKKYDAINNIEEDKRKFKENDNNIIRVCDTLLYHCFNESRYITDLKKALTETGFNDEDNRTEFEYKLKDSFKKSKYYKNGKLFVNKQVEKTRQDINSISEDIIINVENHQMKKALINNLYSDEIEDKNITEQNIKEKNYNYKVKNIEKRIILKALRQFDIFSFDNLKKYYPNLKSLSEFISSDNYAGRFEINVYRNSSPTNLDIYNTLLDLLNKLSTKIFAIKKEYYGTHTFEEIELSEYIKDVVRRKDISPNSLEEKEGEGISQGAPQINPEYRMDLSNKEWYVYNDNYGTTEEKRFVKYFSTKIDDLRKKYNHIFLIRNEQKIKIFSFDEGLPFEPDYILILETNGKITEQQHIFIEAKGEHLEQNDSNKEKFLNQLEKKAECKIYSSDKKYRIIGMPFYTHQKENKFKEAFEKII